MFHCAGCSQDATTYRNMDELEIHIASDHINYVPYECEKCRFSRFPTEFALHSHYTNDHGLKEFYVKYKVTPESGRKRQLVKELLQKSLTISENATTNRSSKRKRTSAVEVIQSTTPSALSPCSSQDSDNCHHTSEADRNVKTEDVKEDGGPSEKNCADKELDQHVVVAASGEITLNSNYPSYGAYNEVMQNEGGSLFDIGLKSVDGMNNDMSQNYFTTESGDATSSMLAQSSTTKRRRPPRVCTECGLQVSGQRSSLVYHANSKHLRLPLFYCRPCNKTWTTVTKSDVLKHVKAVHHGDESNIIDYRRQCSDKIREITDKCFPPKQRAGTNDEDTECNNADGGLSSLEGAGSSAERLHWLGAEDSSGNT